MNDGITYEHNAQCYEMFIYSLHIFALLMYSCNLRSRIEDLLSRTQGERSRLSIQNLLDIAKILQSYLGHLTILSGEHFILYISIKKARL